MRVKSVATTNVPRIAVGNAVPVSHRTRRTPHAVVLQTTANAEWDAVVDVDFIELADRHVATEVPRLAAIPRDGNTAVAADDHVVRCVGINPECVVFAVHVAEPIGERLATVTRDIEPAIRTQRVDVRRVAGIDADLRVVVGTRVQGRGSCPRRAGVERAIDTGVWRACLHRRVHHVCVLRVQGKPNASLVDRGEAVGESCPRRSTVGALVDVGSGASAVESPRASLALIHRGVQHERVGRVDHQIGRAGVFVNEKHLRPGASAVCGLEYAAFRVRPPEVSAGGDVDDVDVGRIDDNATDRACVPEPHVGPRRAAVGTLVDTVAPARTLSGVCFAGTEPDCLRRRWRDRHRADRHHRVDGIKDGIPGNAVVRTLP